MGSLPLSSNLYFLTCFSLVVSICNTLEDCNFTAIYNFGDSNSDTGAFSAAYQRRPLPYGETFFRQQSGRYSDGRLIIDFLANNFSLPFLSAYLNSIGANYTYGANFAVAGATIGLFEQSFDIPAVNPFYLYLEYSQFKQFIPRSQMVKEEGGLLANLLPTEETFSQGLYTIDIGQNDIAYMFAINKTVEEVKATVPDIINNVSQCVQSLYDLGARSFWIHNTGPVGCLACLLALVPIEPEQMDIAGCGQPFNDAAQYFNQALLEEVVVLRKKLRLAAITYVDIYSIKYSFFSQPQQYGFVEPLVVCCGVGSNYYNYNDSIPCGVAAACANPSSKVVWDGTHYTDAANKIVFEKISSGNFSDPPIPPKFACHRSIVDSIMQSDI